MQPARAARVREVVQSAWQRRLAVLAVEQLAIALAFVLGGGILMLVLGTQILAWYWLALLAVAGIALATYRIRVRLVEPYRVAQLLDRRLQLSDSLSTAWFLLSRKEDQDDPVASFQLEYAERVAERVELRNAFPMAGRRAWALAGGLAALAFGLFAVRYLVTQSLSLRQSLVPIHLVEVIERVQRAFAPDKDAEARAADADNEGKTARPERDAKKDGQPLPRAEEAQMGKPDGTRGGQQAVPQTPQEAREAQDAKQETREGNPDANASQPQSGQKPTEERNSQQASSKQSESKNDGSSQQSDGQKSAGLMDKMKDALSSLMAKVHPNAPRQQEESRRGAEDRKQDEQSSAGKDSNGNPQQNARDQQASEQQSAEGQAQGQTTEKTQAGQGKSSDQSADKKSSEAHSGVGRQDGDKNVKETEQLKAMGKLAEIIGKRSASVTGDMTLENPSGKQQLTTQYSQRLGHHADLGGEINRDDVPLMYQQYVREYMEQVRKQAKSQ